MEPYTGADTGLLRFSPGFHEKTAWTRLWRWRCWKSPTHCFGRTFFSSGAHPGHFSHLQTNYPIHSEQWCFKLNNENTCKDPGVIWLFRDSVQSVLGATWTKMISRDSRRRRAVRVPNWNQTKKIYSCKGKNWLTFGTCISPKNTPSQPQKNSKKGHQPKFMSTLYSVSM